MEIQESPEQFSVRMNKFISVQLDYHRIVSHLIQAGVITQQQNAQIQEEYADNAGRMQELISRLIQLNSVTSFIAFREAVRNLGAILLTEKLLRDHSTFVARLNIVHAHTCLFTYDVLDKIFSYLGQRDISRARLVCQMWNAVISACHMKKFRVMIPSLSGHQRISEFLSSGTKSDFCSRLTRFVFDSYCTRKLDPVAWKFYKTFFGKFGPKMQSLELSYNLSTDSLDFIVSPEILQRYKNLKHLKIVLPRKEISLKDSLVFLSALESLSLTNYVRSRKSWENCLDFVEPLLTSNQNLKTLYLHLIPKFDTLDHPNPSAALPILVKSTTLESLTFIGQCNLGDLPLRLMTILNGGGRLKVIDFGLGNVSERVFHDFLLSHAQTLRKISITIPSNAIQIALPHLEALEYLKLDAYEDGFLPFDSIFKLGLCTQAPNLRCLEISMVSQQTCFQTHPPFIHKGVKELRITLDCNSTAEGIREFMSHVTHCFPNMTKFQIQNLDEDVLALPTQVGQLKLQWHVDSMCNLIYSYICKGNTYKWFGILAFRYNSEICNSLAVS